MAPDRDPTADLMTREEVSEHLGIPINQVRKAMSRAGIPHLAGWPRDAVENLERPGKGWRAGQMKDQKPLHPTEGAP